MYLQVDISNYFDIYATRDFLFQIRTILIMIMIKNFQNSIMIDTGIILGNNQDCFSRDTKSSPTLALYKTKTRTDIANPL